MTEMDLIVEAIIWLAIGITIDYEFLGKYWSGIPYRFIERTTRHDLTKEQIEKEVLLGFKFVANHKLLKDRAVYFTDITNILRIPMGVPPGDDCNCEFCQEGKISWDAQRELIKNNKLGIVEREEPAIMFDEMAYWKQIWYGHLIRKYVKENRGDS
jgi:hypothetical protein